MRMQITLPPELAERLRQLAVLEHRYPRQQAEVLLYRALQSAGDSHERALPQDAARAAAGSAAALVAGQADT